jgi:hypothetical protein
MSPVPSSRRCRAATPRSRRERRAKVERDFDVLQRFLY